MDGPTEVSLEDMQVRSTSELLELPTLEIAKRLGDAPFPPSEKLLGAVLLKAVDELRGATADLARSSREMDRKTRALVTVGWITVAVAFVSLVVAVVAIVK
jgi:hypothetical protein